MILNPNINPLIHPLAIVDPKAELGAGVEVEPFSTIQENVKIGDNTIICSHARIVSGTSIGHSCKIFHGAVVGSAPQDLKYEGENSTLEIGNNTTIREYCTLNRGTKNGGMLSKVGDNSLLMAYVHVAHDCIIGNNVILANAIGMAGHINIADNVTIGGICAIHQFVKIGKFAFIGGLARISQDVPPFILTTGEKMKYYGPNRVGLLRSGFSKERIQIIKRAYNFIYRKKLNLSQAVSAIRQELPINEDVKDILDFIDKSDRGLMGR